MSSSAAVAPASQSIHLTYPASLAVFFLSGFSSLVYQVVWVKMLTRSFGVTAFAVSAVLGAFFAGLALGSYFGGRLADRRADGLRLYGGLEIVIGLYALALPYIFEDLTPLYRALYPSIQDSPALVAAARFGLSFLLLILPTTLMGATLPLLLRALVAGRDELTGQLSRLYALNTLGAVAGALGTGYVLIGLAGLSLTTWVAAFGNFAAGVVALLLARNIPPAPAAQVPAGEGRERPARSTNPLARRLPVVMFLSGFAALGYEVIWTRVFTVFSDHSIFAYTAIVAVVLMGIALGSAWVGRSEKRSGDPTAALALVEIGLGLSALLSLPASAVAAQIFPVVDTSFGPARLNGNPIFFFLVVFIVIIFPSLCMGATFPLAAQAYARSADKLARKVGEIYSANVLGATFGSILVGFGLLPLFGAQRSMLITATINLIAAGLLIPADKNRRLALAVGGLAAVTLGGTAFAPDRLYNWLFAAQYPANRIVANFEDVEMTVTVTEYDGHNFIFLNGHHQAETLPRTLGIHRLIGHLPALVHGGPQTALVIGLGGGATSGAVAMHAQDRVQIVELSAAMVSAAELFGPFNNNVLADPRTDVRIADGRNFLLLTDQTYDLITADIIPPLHAYSSLLYSFEYYHLLAEHLSAGGIVCQWLDRRLEPHEQLILARTFVQAFPHSAIWEHEPYTILLGSNQPIMIESESIAGQFTSQVADDLAPLGITGAGSLLAGFAESDEALRDRIGPGLIIDDDHPYNEYFRLLRVGNLWRVLE